jgi:hypothetical protein
MGNTRKAALVAAGICWAAAAGCTGEASDPRAIARELASVERAPVADNAPRLLSASFAASPAPAQSPAPLAEPARHVHAFPSAAAVAVGNEAARMLPPALWPAFAASGARFALAQEPCSDRDAVEWMMLGRAELAVISGQLSRSDARSGLRETRLGVELFGLVVPAESPVRSLTHRQVRQLLTGEVTSWRQLGVAGGDLLAVVPSDPALAARAAKALIPGDPFAKCCLPVASDQHVVDQLLRNPGAVGVVRVTAAPRDAGTRWLQIDWTTPSADAFSYGTYPFGLPLTMVTAGAPGATAAALAAFVRTPAGRELLAGDLCLLP